MNLFALPAFTANHIWMRHAGRCAVAADPGESAPVIAALDSRKLVLAPILGACRVDAHGARPTVPMFGAYPQRKNKHR